MTMEMENRGSTGSGLGSGSPNGDHGGAGGAGAGDGNLVNVRAINVDASIQNNTESINLPRIGESSGGNVAAAVSVAGVIGSGNVDLAVGKKRRGRPRKYDTNGNLNPSYIKSVPPSQLQSSFSQTAPPTKRGRGRPSAASTWPILPSFGDMYGGGGAGSEFTPHIITVNTGEDVAGKIVTFAQKGHCRICVLSANGSVSNVTLRQPASSSGLLTYEGHFEILTLMGSYAISDTDDGMRRLTGGLSICLVGSNGHIFGGAVAGSLTAANPVQMVIGSFGPYEFKLPKAINFAGHQTAAGTSVARVPVSQAVAGANNSCTFRSSQQPPGDAENALAENQQANSESNGAAAEWSGSGRARLDQRPSPDINASVSFEER